MATLLQKRAALHLALYSSGVPFIGAATTVSRAATALEIELDRHGRTLAEFILEYTDELDSSYEFYSDRAILDWLGY